jgi:hypothetical protein
LTTVHGPTTRASWGITRRPSDWSITAMSSADIEQYRETAENLAKRAEQDETFATQAKADPLGTITSAGIPEETAKQMLNGGLTEVTGYMRPEGGSCADTTCWISACPGSCAISL